MKEPSFEWDDGKDRANREKHGVSFVLAQHAFFDPDRVIVEDGAHGGRERRFYCIGRAGGGILTVRFTWRRHVVRIIGAGFWRKGRKIYEEEHHIYR